MIKIDNNKTVQVAIPFEEVLDTTSLWGQGAYKLLIEGSPQFSAMLDEVKVKVVAINYIEDNFFRAVLVELIKDSKGFQINWMNYLNEPFVEILKADLVPEFDNDAKLENDTHYLIPLRLYKEDGSRDDAVKSDEIKAWTIAYANADFNNMYSDPASITTKKLDYTQEVK